MNDIFNKNFTLKTHLESDIN